MMTTTLSNTAPLAALDAAIMQARLCAEAERALDAVSENASNPFAGSSDRLRRLEADRLTVDLRTKGELLAKALSEFNSLNSEITDLGADHRETQHAISELKSNPLIKRFISAPTIARNVGEQTAWSAVAGFLASDAAWTDYPRRIADHNVILPEPLRFQDEDRDTIRSFVKLEKHAAETSAKFTVLIQRRERLIQLHPALQSLPHPAP